jgi:hypothetical protein
VLCFAPPEEAGVLTREVVVKRVLSTTVGAACVAFVVFASIALGSTGGKQAAAGRSLIVVKERGSAHGGSDHTVRGRFSLLLNGVIEDSGTTDITPSGQAVKTVGGQKQEPVFSYHNLTSKKGTLSSSFAA